MVGTLNFRGIIGLCEDESLKYTYFSVSKSSFRSDILSSLHLQSSQSPKCYAILKNRGNFNCSSRNLRKAVIRRRNVCKVSETQQVTESESGMSESHSLNLDETIEELIPELAEKGLMPDSIESKNAELVPMSEFLVNTPLGLGHWFEFVAAPWLSKVVQLRIQEDPNMERKPSPKWPERPQGVLMGWAIIEHDKACLETIAAFLQWGVDSWRVPLQPSYDHEAAAAYFARRPHLIVFRLFQTSVALSSMAVSLIRDNRAASWTVDPEEMASRRTATAMKLKNTLVRLGPTFIKVAQSLSARPDVIGPDTARVLSSLQDRLPPFPTETALKILQQELGPSPLTCSFSHLSLDPVAAASFGQVYRACTVDGEDVAVKVQRPGVLHAVARDILILRILLGWVRKLARVNSDLGVLADELGRGLYGELDYRLEAKNAETFRRAHEQFHTVDVPQTRADLTARRVLTMEWMEGERPADLLAAAKAAELPAQARQLARDKLMRLVAIGVESSLVQLLDSGVMHADPHPGNLLLTPRGHVAYLDFGLLTHMERSHQSAMLAAIAHLVNAEWAPLAGDLADMGVLKPHTDRTAVSRALEEAFGVDTVSVSGIPEIRFGQVTTKLWQIAVRFRFKLPPYYTLVLRSLASLEGIGLAVDPSFKVFAAAYPYVVRRLLTDNEKTSRKVLRNLLLTDLGRFRWDRLAALAKSSREAERVKRSALMTWTAGKPLSEATPTPVDLEPSNERSKGAALMELILSSQGSSARRVLLDANTVALAQAFVSREAAAVRRKLASAVSVLTFSSHKTTGPTSNSTAKRVQNKRLWFLAKTMSRRLRGNVILKIRVFWTLVTIMVAAFFFKVASLFRWLKQSRFVASTAM